MAASSSLRDCFGNVCGTCDALGLRTECAGAIKAVNNQLLLRMACDSQPCALAYKRKGVARADQTIPPLRRIAKRKEGSQQPQSSNSRGAVIDSDEDERVTMVSRAESGPNLLCRPHAAGFCRCLILRLPNLSHIQHNPISEAEGHPLHLF